MDKEYRRRQALLLDFINSLSNKTNLFKQELLKEYKQVSRLYQKNKDPQLEFRLKDLVQAIESTNKLWEMLREYNFECFAKIDYSDEIREFIELIEQIEEEESGN